ncbi:MAG: hypothetical protein NTW29_16845 [Bacteroidetes bacterium]|nr:hypothetical protein [Bacteroidota bacterium]
MTPPTIITPFNYNAGINYESWTMGRTTMSIPDDLTFITGYFSLIKTFHDMAVGTTAIEIDPTQQQVISFITANTGQPVQLIMGTNNSALAQGGYGTPWSAGLMTSSSYTDQWVDVMINAFGSTQAMLSSLACICLGNEVDANGPPSSDSNFIDYYTVWIPAAFNNLSASLNKNGLGSIPVTSIIANYPLGSPSSNLVATSVSEYIIANWSSLWNQNTPFVFFNQYTPDNGQSTDFSAVSSYFTQVQQILGSSCQVFVGETGYSSEFNTPGENNQATVISDLFSWLEAEQQADNGINTPLCVFQAFDCPAMPPGQQQFGLFLDNTTGYSVKTGISIPGWVNTPLQP